MTEGSNWTKLNNLGGNLKPKIKFRGPFEPKTTVEGLTSNSSHEIMTCWSKLSLVLLHIDYCIMRTGYVVTNTKLHFLLIQSLLNLAAEMLMCTQADKLDRIHLHWYYILQISVYWLKRTSSRPPLQFLILTMNNLLVCVVHGGIKKYSVWECWWVQLKSHLHFYEANFIHFIVYDKFFFFFVTS